MSSYLVRASAFFFVLVSAVSCRADVGPAKADTPQESQVVRQARQLREKLALSVTLDKGVEADTKFQDSLDFLSDRYALNLLLDKQAFRDDLGLDQVAEMKVTLPVMKEVRLSTVLRMLTANVGGTYLVMSDHILITTPQRARPEEWLGANRNRAPTVTVDFDKRPLEDALKELSSLTGINILLDLRVSESAKTPVTVTLSNAPLDTAVQLLADMAGLGFVTVDGMLFVTSQEHAFHLKEERERSKVDTAMPKAEEKAVAPAPTKQSVSAPAKKPQK